VADWWWVSAGLCSHGPLEDEHDKAWLEQGLPTHKALVEVVLVFEQRPSLWDIQVCISTARVMHYV